jgi:4-amino-4-deoxy-L-arabinose transferase-like glycosyltransferase
VFLDRVRGNATVLVLAAAGFLLTIAYGAYLAPDWDPIRDDQRQYIALAHGIAERGEFTRASGAEAFVPEPLRFPGYPLFIAPLCAVGCSHWAITVAQALLVAALVIVIAKYATVLVGAGGGIVAAALVAFNPSFAFFGAHALSDLLATVLLVASVAATALLVPRDAHARGLAAGSLFAFAALTRPVLVFALPLSMVVITLRHGLLRVAAPMALAVVAFALIVTPYLAHVESSFGRPIVGSSGALLYVAYFQGLAKGDLDAMELVQEEAGRAAIARFDAVAGRAEQARAWIALDDELRDRGLALIAHNPWGFALRGVPRSVVLWSGEVPLRAQDITPTSETLWHVTSLALFALGLIGALRLVRREDAGSALPLLVILATWALSFPLSAEGRYSLPAQPFVAIGLAAMLRRLRKPGPIAVSRRARVVQTAPE